VCAAGVFIWVLSTCWFPIISSAIDRLGDGGAVESGQLNWPGDSAKVLAENRFIAITVDLEHTGETRSPSHLQVEFGRSNVRFYSLFGCAEIPYGKGHRMAFNV